MRTLPRSLPTYTSRPTGTPATPDVAAHPASTPLLPPATWPGQDILTDSVTAYVLQAVWSGDPAVVVGSPPGAGKTRLVSLLGAALAHRADLRVGIAAQTRDQAVELARRLGTISTRTRLMWSGRDRTPPKVPGVPALSGAAAAFPTDHGGCVIATTARWLYAEPDAMACDVMIVDEAWQATYADLGALGAFAQQIVCVGDPGQIAPVVTGATSRWRHSPTGPHLPGPVALRNAHGNEVIAVTLPNTWRLGPDTTALIQPAFYPQMPFTSRRPPEHLTSNDTRLPEVAHRRLAPRGGPGDPALARACDARVRELLQTTHHSPSGTRTLTAEDIAVITPHVNQACAVRALLADTPGVLIGTANQLQGLERIAAVAIHPFAGYRNLSPFAADTGRACVMLSRHRSHLTLIVDDATQQLLGAIPADDPATRTHQGLLTDILTSAEA